jgi:hypothetical protein
VISTDKIEGNLPQGTVLLAYDLERTGRIETASLGEFGEQQSAAISKVLERQANPNIDASTVTSTDEDAGENSSQSANQTDDKADTQSTTSDGETESAEASGSDTSGDTESERVSSVMETVSGIIDRITELFS